MAGSKYSYYLIQLYKRQLFSQDQPVNTDWFDEAKNGAYTQNNISVSGSTENIKYFFSVGNYEEKANGLLLQSNYFRNNNEYKISKKLTQSKL
jgi:hypothetical protein